MIEANNQDTDDLKKTMRKHGTKFTKIYSDFNKVKTPIKHIMVKNHHFSPDNMDSQKSQDTDTLDPDNKKAPLL